jgi:hypothetical protein
MFKTAPIVLKVNFTQAAIPEVSKRAHFLLKKPKSNQDFTRVSGSTFRIVFLLYRVTDVRLQAAKCEFSMKTIFLKQKSLICLPWELLDYFKALFLPPGRAGCYKME